YNVTYKLVNAADYGVPQKRERVIIVGVRSDLGIDWSFPSPTHSEDALLWSQFVTDEYWNRHGIANTFDDTTINEVRAYLKGKYGMFGPELQPWLTIRDAISDVGEQDVMESRSYPGHTGSFIDEPSKTIKAGAHGVPGGENMVRFPDDNIRYLTIDETKRIQTFPDNYAITGSRTEAMRQLGNAVPVKLAFVVASSLVKALEK
ncbi:MAG: DNA cytosine methyltransferase, partial [Bacteroidales bacterium]|nr:DNA cytosine methyltransferase [Bacteroidales bacterium]